MNGHNVGFLGGKGKLLHFFGYKIGVSLLKQYAKNLTLIEKENPTFYFLPFTLLK